MNSSVQMDKSFLRRRTRSDLRPLLSAGLGAVVTVLAVGVFLIMPRLDNVVFAPVAAGALIVAAFLVHIRLRTEGAMSFLELGVFNTAVLSAYAFYPPIAYVLRGNTFGDQTDGRLMAGPLPGEVANITWLYVLLISSFCVAYAAVRPRVRGGAVLAKRPDRALILSIILLIVAARAVILVMTEVYSLNPESYLDAYLVVQKLPQLPRQIFSQVAASETTLDLLLIVALVASYRKTRWLLLLLLIPFTIANLLHPMSRSAFFSVLLIGMVAYDLLVRRIRARWLTLLAVAGFVLMAVMATARDVGSSIVVHIPRVDPGATEFDVIFANAYELTSLHPSAGVFRNRPDFYLSGLVWLIPQQLLPFQKMMLSGWFISTFSPEYAAAGGTYAFGIVSEVIVGRGWPDAIWRGALVGLFFGMLQRHMALRRVSLAFVAFYVWQTVWCYLIVRESTFAPVPFIVYRFAAPLVVVYATAALLRPRLRGAPLRAEVADLVAGPHTSEA